MSKGRYGSSMTVEYAPGYWRKRKRRLAESKRQLRAARRANPQPERPPVEYDLPTGKTRFGSKAGSAEECSAERSKVAPRDNGVEPAEGRTPGDVCPGDGSQAIGGELGPRAKRAGRQRTPDAAERRNR